MPNDDSVSSRITGVVGWIPRPPRRAAGVLDGRSDRIDVELSRAVVVVEGLLHGDVELVCV